MARDKKEDLSANFGLSSLLYFGGIQPRNQLDLKTNRDLIMYHLNMMFEKTNSMFEYGGDFGKGKSELITRRYLEAVTQTKGYSTIIEVNGKLYCTWGTIGGEPRYDYLPKRMIVANPYIPIRKEFIIDEDCVFYKNDAFAWGLYPTNLYYAMKLCDNDQSRRVLMIATRAMKLLHANDTDTKKAFDNTIADLEAGKLSAIFDDSIKALSDIEALDFGSSGTSQTFIQLLEDYQYQKGSWWNELGVQSNYNMKRETITSSENILNVDSLLPFSDNMFDARKEQIEKINKMFGVNWTVDFSSAWKKIRKEIKQKEEAIEAEAQAKRDSLTVRQGGKPNENSEE